jgi:ferritin
MISKEMQAAFNKQINAEMYSSYLYMAMSAWFEKENLPGFAKWMRAQAGEENGHAMKFFNHILERGGEVELEAIDKPKASWGSVLEVFEDTCAHERLVTEKINDLVDMAASEKDHASSTFLQYFVSEQVEEEAQADSIRQRLAMINESSNGLFMFDQVMGRRE